MTFSSVPLLMAGAFGLIVLKKSPLNVPCITFLTSVMYNFRINQHYSAQSTDVVENIFCLQCLFLTSTRAVHAKNK